MSASLADARLGGSSLAESPAAATALFNPLFIPASPPRVRIEAELLRATRALKAGHVHESIERLNAALAIDRHNAKALGMLGRIAVVMGQPQAALPLLRRSISEMPELEFHLWLALCLEMLDRKDEAATEMRQVIATMPQTADAFYAVGLALEGFKQHRQAAGFYARSIARDPDRADAHHRFGMALKACGEIAPSVAAFFDAIRRKGDKADYYIDLSSALADLGQFDEALVAARIAVQLNPKSCEAHNNVAHALLNLNRSDEAVVAYELAIALRPDFSIARFGYATALLKTGDFARGWREYEWRWKDCLVPRSGLPGAPWQDEDPAGKRILVYGEQGFGDVLQFSRLATRLGARGAVVYLEVPKPLHRIMRTIDGIAGVYAVGETLPEFDLHVPLASLPNRLALTPGDIPADPYLHIPLAERQREGEAIRARATASQADALVVGLVWAGDPRPNDPRSNLIDRRRSTTLAQLSPLFALPGISFVSFQLGTAREQLAVENAPVLDAMTAPGDFADTAAKLAGVDLLISVDTAMVHLAGAVGLPVWMLSRFDACWRWGDRAPGSPWYPGMRIFRQPSPGNWPGVVAEVSAALREVRAQMLNAA